MRHPKHFICLAILINTSVFALGFARDVPNSVEQLRSELESALKIKDTNSVMSLFDLEGEPNESRESAKMREMIIKHQTMAMLQTSNIVVKMLPLPAEFPFSQTNEQNGLCTKFNVTPIGLIEVKNQNGSVQRLPYGEKAGGFYIAEIIQERIPGQLLDIRVLAGPNTDLLTYTGRWAYVKDGQEINVEVSDKTNRFVTRWGDYIKSCEIRRTSTNQVAGFPTWFYFQVIEGGTNVFESPELTNEDLFIYHKGKR